MMRIAATETCAGNFPATPSARGAVTSTWLRPAGQAAPARIRNHSSGDSSGPPQDGHRAAGAVDLYLVAVGDEQRGQPDAGHGGYPVLAPDDGRVRQGAAAVAHAGGDLGEGGGPVG